MRHTSKKFAPEASESEPGWGLQQNIEALEKGLERHLTWIRQADTKAQMLVAINLVLVGCVLGQMPSRAEFSLTSAVVVVIGVILPTWSLFKCFVSMSPHVKGAADSIIFFGNVGRLDLDTYRQAVISRTQEDYIDDLIVQTHINAKIAAAKYNRIKAAAYVTFLSGPFVLCSSAALFFHWHPR